MATFLISPPQLSCTGIALILLVLSFLATPSSSSSSSSYSSVQALDKFGNSIQLSHARQAAQQHGTLVMAAIANDGSIVCLSVSFPPKIGTFPTTTKRLIHPLSTAATSQTGIICTGVKADAQWLIHSIRDYQTRVWERYDTTIAQIEPKRIAKDISQVLLDFMGYKRQDEFLDGVGPALTEQQRGWARPLGIQIMVVSCKSPLILLEPSGIMTQYNAYAMGRDSQVCLEELEKLYTPTKTAQELQELLRDIVQRKVIMENPTMFAKAELWIETLTEHGVKQSKTIPSTTTTKEIDD